MVAIVKPTILCLIFLLKGVNKDQARTASEELTASGAQITGGFLTKPSNGDRKGLGIKALLTVEQVQEISSARAHGGSGRFSIIDRIELRFKEPEEPEEPEGQIWIPNGQIWRSNGQTAPNGQGTPNGQRIPDGQRMPNAQTCQRWDEPLRPSDWAAS